MKRILSLFLAAVLAAALLIGPSAAADAAPWLEADGIGTASQTISLRGLSGSFFYPMIVWFFFYDVSFKLSEANGMGHFSEKGKQGTKKKG